jgi:hypothetical protein
MASAPLELDADLERLADANQLVRVRRLGQEYLVHSTQRPCDRIDALMADLCAVL